MNYYTKVSEKKIKTVGTTLKNIFCCGSGPTHRVDIIKNVSGRIQRGKITLVMGPPGWALVLLFELHVIFYADRYIVSCD